MDTTTTETMTGAEALVRTAAAAGVELCFANPGTTEMPVVVALDRVPGMRAVLGLHETVVTGAADGYGRMAGKPALTLLHLGPGFANGIANLHNARRASTPIVNLIGDHASWHVAADAPLTSDIDSLARPVSGWLRHSTAPDAMAADMAEAVAASMEDGGKIATLVLPHDLQDAAADGPATPRTAAPRPGVEDARVAEAADALAPEGAVLMIGSPAMTEAGLKAAGRIAQATGCRLMCGRPVARAERGMGLPAPDPIPYLPEMALEAFAGVRSVVFAGAMDPVTFFGWPGYPSRVIGEACAKAWLAEPQEDVVGALEALVEHVNAPAYRAPAPPERPGPATGPLTAEAVCQTLAALQPDGAVIAEEAITSGWHYQRLSKSAPRFTQISITGGAIGLGPAMATGAAVACPERPVINLQADGSALYCPQALWTQAREGLDVTTVIFSNRSYRILQMEMQRAGLNELGPNAAALTALDRPAIDWPQLAAGFGVPATRAETGEDLADALARALHEPGPALIEAVIA